MAIEFDESFLAAIEDARTTSSARTKGSRYLALLDARPGERILDLGCGGGWLGRSLAPVVAPNGQIVGVDRAAKAVAFAGRLAAGISPGLVTFERAEADHLPFADGTFDAVACISVLMYCEDPGRVLAEARRVLRPGGRLVVASSDEDTRFYGGHDRDLGRRIARAIADRGRDPWLGRRLAYLLESQGFRLAEELALTDIERRFAPGTTGHILAHACRDYLIGAGGISAADYDRWLADLHACEAEGSYCYGVTTYAYRAER